MEQNHVYYYAASPACRPQMPQLLHTVWYVSVLGTRVSCANMAETTVMVSRLVQAQETLY